MSLDAHDSELSSHGRVARANGDAMDDGRRARRARHA
jgi:hypothetical protein